MTKEVTINEMVSGLDREAVEAMYKAGGKIYCGCLDWNDELKAFTLEGWAKYGNHEYHIKEHTTGVTPLEVKEFYYQ